MREQQRPVRWLGLDRFMQGKAKRQRGREGEGRRGGEKHQRATHDMNL